MAKVMISLPDDVLQALDAEADRRGTTRSGLIRELTEATMRERNRLRAVRMAEIDADRDRRRGHGGNVAEVVKAHRPR